MCPAWLACKICHHMHVICCPAWRAISPAALSAVTHIDDESEPVWLTGGISRPSANLTTKNADENTLEHKNCNLYLARLIEHCMMS
jgi:hypothetical protein